MVSCRTNTPKSKVPFTAPTESLPLRSPPTLQRTEYGCSGRIRVITAEIVQRRPRPHPPYPSAGLRHLLTLSIALHPPPAGCQPTAPYGAGCTPRLRSADYAVSPARASTLGMRRFVPQPLPGSLQPAGEHSIPRAPQSNPLTNSMSALLPSNVKSSKRPGVDTLIRAMSTAISQATLFFQGVNKKTTRKDAPGWPDFPLSRSHVQNSRRPPRQSMLE